jgi:hypothetical protein
VNRKLAILACLAIVGLTILAMTPVASAFINPKFTPRDLISQSETAVVLEIKSLDSNSGIAVATVTTSLKADPNKPAPKEIKIDFLAMGEQLSEQGKSMMRLVSSGYTQAILFSGKFDPGGNDQDKLDDASHSRGFLNIAGKWLILDEDPNSGNWEMEKMWEYLLGTWAGSTDMFLKCLNCVQADPDFDVPCNEGVQWDSNSIARVGKVAGKVAAAIPVDLTGKGPTDLFVASEGGDHLFRWDGKKMVDVTAKLAITSKSAAVAWGDFNGDGKLALASWDGKALSILSQKDDGAFAAKACDLGDALKDGCVSLAALDVGVKGKAGLLVGTKGWPVLLVPKGPGAFDAKPLGSGVQPGKLGQAGVCLVADLDGDGIVDVLQIFPDGSLFYKGSAPGAFAAPVPTAIAAGPGRWGACLADFSGGGLQDVFIAGEDRNGMWANLGGGKFTDMMGFCGSLAYISKNGGIGAWGGDINNDGKQDLLLVYGTNKMAAQLFFNRGFRCFGLCRDELDIAQHKSALEALDKDLVVDCSEPQQAGCLADFNGDGALDMALVLSNGDVVLFPRKVNPDVGALGVTVFLPAGSSTPGPVSVSATLKDGRNLGSWVVRQGDGGAMIGTRASGKITLKWTLPDGKSQQKEVRVVGPIRSTLDK